MELAFSREEVLPDMKSDQQMIAQPGQTLPWTKAHPLR